MRCFAGSGEGDDAGSRSLRRAVHHLSSTTILLPRPTVLLGDNEIRSRYILGPISRKCGESVNARLAELYLLALSQFVFNHSGHGGGTSIFQTWVD